MTNDETYELPAELWLPTYRSALTVLQEIGLPLTATDEQIEAAAEAEIQKARAEGALITGGMAEALRELVQEARKEATGGIIGYNVYYAPSPDEEDFCGFVPVVDYDLEATLAECRKLADSDGDSLPSYLYGTARAAGGIWGLDAPDTAREADGPCEWFGEDGYYCAVAVFGDDVDDDDDD